MLAADLTRSSGHGQNQAAGSQYRYDLQADVEDAAAGNQNGAGRTDYRCMGVDLTDYLTPQQIQRIQDWTAWILQQLQVWTVWAAQKAWQSMAWVFSLDRSRLTDTSYWQSELESEKSRESLACLVVMLVTVIAAISASFHVLGPRADMWGACIDSQTPRNIKWSTHTDLCLTVPKGEERNGGFVQMATCDPYSPDNQHFLFGSSVTKIHLASAPELCVDVKDHRDQNGAIIQVWSCIATDVDQNFMFSPTSERGKLQWVSHSEKCVDVRDHSTTPGVHLQLWDCMDGDADQYFSADEACPGQSQEVHLAMTGIMRGHYTGMCLTRKLQLQPCRWGGYGVEQTWQADANGRLRIPGLTCKTSISNPELQQMPDFHSWDDSSSGPWKYKLLSAVQHQSSLSEPQEGWETCLQESLSAQQAMAASKLKPFAGHVPPPPFAFVPLPHYAQLTKVSLKDIDSKAVCNDGSPAAYYFRPGQEGTRTWMVYLEPGGWCDHFEGHDWYNCFVRRKKQHWLTSSWSWPPFEHKSGIFDDINGPLWGAHLAYVKYCSSDGHMGDADYPRIGWKFRGWHIVRAAARHLASRGMKKGDVFIMAGASAGSRGAMAHLDTIHEVLPEGVKVMGFLDSPLWVGLPEVNVTWQTESVKRAAAAYISKRILEPCGVMFGPDETWKCAIAEYRLLLLKSPFLVVASQYDAYGLQGTCHPNEESKRIHEAYSAKVREVVGGLGPHAAVVSGTCWNHAQSATPRFDLEHFAAAKGDTYGSTVSVRSMLESTLKKFKEFSAVQNEYAPQVVFQKQIDQSCDTIDCGQFCLPPGKMCFPPPPADAPSVNFTKVGRREEVPDVINAA
eukprot:TRINITY_DN91568_c0_g1_i1.p1 TRINITY_DN91568_c0_g1~~TRINITY_DN91568_c0_g1_i1.p1  ORF type:complete len:845 (-),score=126.78 TRINITY_DN91568_c0_g1_i1:77-2611(-)